TNPLQHLVCRPRPRHAARRARVARARRRVHHRPRRPVRDDPHGHEKTRRRARARRPRHHREGRPRAHLPAGLLPARGRSRLDRTVPPTLVRAPRRAGPGGRRPQSEGRSAMIAGKESKPRKPTTIERTSDREIVVTRSFAAPAQLVFEAWSEPELFKQWWVPRSMGMTLQSCEMDVRTGGRYRL